MRGLQRTGLLLVSGALLALWRAPAVGQWTFYGAPPPADIAVEVDGEESPAARWAGIFTRRPLGLTLAVREGFDSNVFQTKNHPVRSFYTNWAAGLNYQVGGSRFKARASLGGGATYYYSRPGDKVDFNGLFDLNATYLATPRWTLSLATSTAYLSQPDQTIVGGSDQQNGDYVFSTTTVSAAYRLAESLSAVTSYNFSTLAYMERDINDQLGYISQTLVESLRWLWKPETALVAEYRINLLNYFSAGLNSLGNYFLLGFDTSLSPRCTWSLRGGLQVNDNHSPVEGSSTYVGPYGQSILTYRLGPVSTLTWYSRYGTEASGLADVSQRQTVRTGFVLVRAITARVSANLAVDYQGNYYEAAGVIASFFENILTVGAGGKFVVNRLLSLEAGYQYSANFAPENNSREYTRNVVFLGANSSF